MHNNGIYSGRSFTGYGRFEMREMFDALHGIDMNASPPPQGKVETYAMARTRADVLYVSVAFAPTSSGTSLLELGLTNVKWL